MNQSESLSDIERWVEDRLAGVAPAILGSLSLRRSPCIRDNCPACLSGEQHPSYVLYGRAEGGRCLDNGRAVQELLYEAAPRYVKALKRERAKASKRRAR